MVWLAHPKQLKEPRISRFCFRGRYKAGSQQFSLLEFQIMELDASATRFLLAAYLSFHFLFLFPNCLFLAPSSFS